MILHTAYCVGYLIVCMILKIRLVPVTQIRDINDYPQQSVYIPNIIADDINIITYHPESDLFRNCVRDALPS